VYRGLAVSPSLKIGVFADEPWLSIEWDRLQNCVYAEWKGCAERADCRASVLRVVGAMRELRVPALVSDNRRLEGVANADQLWIRDTWTPLAVTADLKRIAVVVAHHGLGKIATLEILSQIGTSAFSTRTFTTVSEVTEWAADA